VVNGGKAFCPGPADIATLKERMRGRGREKKIIGYSCKVR
jgi:hypothetical protein